VSRSGWQATGEATVQVPQEVRLQLALTDFDREFRGRRGNDQEGDQDGSAAEAEAEAEGRGKAVVVVVMVVSADPG
jgi:hypothetical protein